MDSDKSLSEALLPQHSYQSVPHTLCSVCKGIISKSQHFSQRSTQPDDALILSEDFVHYQSYQELRTSARQGCHICSLALASKQDRVESLDSATYKFRITSAYRGSGRNWDETAIFAIVLSVDNEPWPMWPFGIVAYAEWQFTEGILPPTPLSWYTAADDTYERARSWISDCLTDHNDCQRSVVQFSLPTRLVHISQEPQKLRLVLGEQLTPNTEYLALSYCWGTDVFETSCLKEHNLESFSQCIPFDTLPKTIQDAIVITRRLGYSYIWIDRLCIIQDSQFDWLNESYSMGKYYHNSTCSIAAMDAASSTEGCFAHRNPLYFQVCAVETDSDKRIFLHLLDNSPTKGPFMADGATALTSRAWVVQERFLSARTIYYGRDGIYWECRMHTWSQTETNLYTTRKAQSETPLRRDYKYRGRAVVGGSQKGTLYKLFNPLDSVSARMNFQIAWDCLVNYYTRCAMTCSTDRLMAIMGIIILVDSRMSLKSSAGLWHHFLPTQLLWRRALPVRRGPLELGERIQNKAPTWSWGSIPGTINLTYHPGVLQSEDETLGGMECQAMILQDKQDETKIFSWPLGLSSIQNWRLRCRIDYRRPMVKAMSRNHQDMAFTFTYVRAFLHNGSADERMYAFNQDLAVPDNLEVWLLPMAWRIAGRREPELRYGLVVRPLDETLELWTRVGTFASRGFKWPPFEVVPTCEGEIEKRIQQLRTIVLI